MNKKLKIGRLAMRKEGDYWVAYYAKEDTLDDRQNASAQGVPDYG